MADNAELIALTEALSLSRDNALDVDQEEHARQDAIRNSVLSGDAALFHTVLKEQGVETNALVFLMDWFHSWQQEYEAFVQVLEAQEEQEGERDGSGDGEEDDEEAVEETEADKPSSVEKDLDELEDEAQEIFQGFAKISIALLDTLAIKDTDAVIDKHGWTLLMQAANSGLRELVNVLVSKGANVNATGKAKDGLNALYLAVTCEHTNEAMVLLKNGAIASATAVVKHREEKKATDDDVDEEESVEEDCAWFQACRTGQLSIVEEMIALGVDINFALPSTGDRALHVAVMFEMQDVAELLVANDSLTLNAKNHSGQTCLFGCSNVELVEFLVDTGVDPRVQDADGETAYSIAHALGDDDVAAFLKPRTH